MNSKNFKGLLFTDAEFEKMHSALHLGHSVARTYGCDTIADDVKEAIGIFLRAGQNHDSDAGLEAIVAIEDIEALFATLMHDRRADGFLLSEIFTFMFRDSSLETSLERIADRRLQMIKDGKLTKL